MSQSPQSEKEMHLVRLILPAPVARPARGSEICWRRAKCHGRLIVRREKPLITLPGGWLSPPVSGDNMHCSQLMRKESTRGLLSDASYCCANGAALCVGTLGTHVPGRVVERQQGVVSDGLKKATTTREYLPLDFTRWRALACEHWT